MPVRHPRGGDARRAGAGGARPRAHAAPALARWAGLLVCVRRGFGRPLALRRLLTGDGFWRFPHVAISDQAVYRRLARDGTGPLERLFRRVSVALAARLAPYAATGLAPFAAGVYALAETTLDRVARLLHALRAAPARPPALLPGTPAGLFDLRRQQRARVAHVADPHQKEKVALSKFAPQPPRI